MAPMALNEPSSQRVDSTKQTSSPSQPIKQTPWQPIKMSSRVAAIGNPIREVIAGIDLSARPVKGEAKPLINLGLGDPSVYGNFPPPVEALTAIEESVRSGKADGYPQVSMK